MLRRLAIVAPSAARSLVGASLPQAFGRLASTTAAARSEEAVDSPADDSEVGAGLPYVQQQAGGEGQFNEDIVFSRTGRALAQLQRMPEPFRSRVVARMAQVLPPEGLLEIGRYDAELAELLRERRVSELAAEGLSGREQPNPYVSNVQYDSKYWTEEDNPAGHTDEDVDQYYRMGADFEATFPDGVPRSMGTEFKLSDRPALMVRSEGVATVKALEAWRQASEAFWSQHGHLAAETGEGAQPLPSSIAELSQELPEGAPEKPFDHVVFTGPRGVGKSGVWMHIVNYARQNGWLVVGIPDCFHLMQDSTSLTAATHPDREGLIDTHDLAHEILQDVVAAHSEQLSSLPQRRQHAWDRYLPHEVDEEAITWKQEQLERETEERARRRMLEQLGEEAAKQAGQDTSILKTPFRSQLLAQLKDLTRDRTELSLLDMAQWGIKHPAEATNTLMDLYQELRLVTEVPVMVAADGINELYEDTLYPAPGLQFDDDLKLGQGDQYSLPAHVRPFDSNGFRADTHSFRRGVCVYTTTHYHRPNARWEDDLDVMEAVPAESQVQVQPASRLAVHNQLLHYHYTGRFSGVLLRDLVDSHLVEMMRTLSGGRPGEVRDSALFLGPVRYGGRKVKGQEDRRTDI